MEYRNVVVLGKRGSPGPLGLGQPNERQMRIHDDKGEIVHRERVPSGHDVFDHRDHEVIDRFIKAAHHKRTGEWQEPPRYQDGSIRRWEEAIAPVAPAKRIPRKWLAFVGIGIAVLLFVVFGNIANENAKRLPSQSEATYYCLDRVMGQLTVPSKAAFSGEKTTGSGRDWTTTGFVEAQNDLGSTVRYRYACYMKYMATTDTWTGNVDITRARPGAGG